MTTPPEQLLTRACRAGAWSPLGEWRIAAPAETVFRDGSSCGPGDTSHRRRLQRERGSAYSRGSAGFWFVTEIRQENDGA